MVSYIIISELHHHALVHSRSAPHPLLLVNQDETSQLTMVAGQPSQVALDHEDIALEHIAAPLRIV